MTPLAGRRILLVDDDDAQTEVVQEVLEIEAAVVLTAGTAAAAEPLFEQQPEAVLVDLNGVDVAAVVDAMRKKAPGCALVLVSGDLRLADHARRIGADGLLAKPYEIDDLVRVVSDAIERKQGHGQSPHAP